ncbi:hypothetical protein J2W25_004612 [Variovorax boronicumulans]|uniref:Uncharacterized protein n=1 Tax=Variovorax boronicumulans TaxID=436515 RepID=A0AAW8E1Y4_9BURK|nr:hypothetical protein [Variovorax boronicumulans]MDP9880284.1 hypothetical protein [Variovorax boronicumulans]MDP9925569.1 hypothetical protein [Variovorax boronicumulans]
MATLTTFALAQDRETWPVLSAWVKELKPEEQRAVLLLLYGEFNDHYIAKIAPANQNSVDGARWAIRMLGWSQFLLSELATKNEDMRIFFREDADRTRVLSFNWSSEKWLEDGRRSKVKLTEFARGVSSRVGDQVMRDHAVKLKRTATALIVASMGGASLSNKQ